MHRRSFLAAQLAGIAALCGCGKKRQGARKPPPAPKIGDTEGGIASWYGHPYHGRRAANGEIYDMEQMTAAHRTLPFGTWVDVENLGNGRNITVRITDRGPFVDGRIIDLSRAAARGIEMIGPGTAKVRVKVVAPPRDLPQLAYFAVQVGAFRDRNRARRICEALGSDFGETKLVERAGNPVVWRVLVGRASTVEEAEGLAARLREQFQGAFVVRLDDVFDREITILPRESVPADH